jgi:hypothetical protein
MDRIILKSKDVETLLQWRDDNADIVRRNPAPFKGIILEFPETNIIIKAYNDAGNIAFYIRINGSSAGKITGQQLPGGLLQVKKNTTKLKSDDVQSIITVYASLMAFIVYSDPAPAAAAAAARGSSSAASIAARPACLRSAAITGTTKTAGSSGSSHIKKALEARKTKHIN